MLLLKDQLVSHTIHHHPWFLKFAYTAINNRHCILYTITRMFDHHRMTWASSILLFLFTLSWHKINAIACLSTTGFMFCHGIQTSNAALATVFVSVSVVSFLVSFMLMLQPDGSLSLWSEVCSLCKIFECAPLKQASKQAIEHAHTWMCNAVLLVCGSVRLTQVLKADS